MGKHDLAKGRFAILGVAEGTPSGFTVRVTGPGKETEFSQTDAASGKFAFTASDGGSHAVCFYNNGTYCGSMPGRVEPKQPHGGLGA
jgi:hypothetical protein